MKRKLTPEVAKSKHNHTWYLTIFPRHLDHICRSLESVVVVLYAVITGSCHMTTLSVTCSSTVHDFLLCPATQLAAPTLDVEQDLKLQYTQYPDLIIERLESLGLPKGQIRGRAILN